MSIRVLLADDHDLFLEGLARLLDLEPDIEVVARASDGMQAITLAEQVKPDVILMDINMPVVDGVEATKRVLAGLPDVGVVILTMYRQDQHVFQAIRSGARGYLLKNSHVEEVVAAIRAVKNGASLIDPGMTAKVLREFRRMADQSDPEGPIGGLTDTEVAILRLVASGMSNKEIAQKLSFSEKTIKNRLSILFQKLEIRDRTQAAIYAMTHGLIPNQY